MVNPAARLRGVIPLVVSAVMYAYGARLLRSFPPQKPRLSPAPPIAVRMEPGKYGTGAEPYVRMHTAILCDWRTDR